MRTEFISLFAALNAKELENLTEEVKETVATINTQNSAPIFTAANLWKIQNMRKTRLVRRSFIV